VFGEPHEAQSVIVGINEKYISIATNQTLALDVRTGKKFKMG